MARNALKRVVTDCRRRRVPAFAYVNNRLEGSVPSTIEAVVEEM